MACLSRVLPVYPTHHYAYENLSRLLSASSFSCLATVLLILYSLASYPSYHHVLHHKTSSTLPIVRPATTPVLNQFHRTHNCQPLSLIPPSAVL